MGRDERLYKLRNLLVAGRCLRPAALLAELEISPATLKRDIQRLRDRFDAPVAWSGELGGWVLESQPPSQQGAQFELPGLWLSAEDIHALLTMQHLLSRLDAGGLLGPHIEPLMRKLGRMLDGGVPPRAEVARRIRVQTVGARRVHLPHFQALGSALLRRRRLQLHYRSRSDGRESAREVSPQRLVHYRDNWYLDAWCHQREALRSFSVDAVQQAQVLHRAAADIPEAELDAQLGAGYGIFAGKPQQWATLRFAPERALGGGRALAYRPIGALGRRRPLGAEHPLRRPARAGDGHPAPCAGGGGAAARGTGRRGAAAAAAGPAAHGGWAG